MHDDWMNEDEHKPEPLTWWDKFWLAVLGTITVLWVRFLWELGGWVALWVKRWF